jgi:hypothetical protein
MERQIKEWVNAHRKEIGLVLATVLVTAKFLPRKNDVAVVQNTDGSYWILPMKKA